MNDNICCKLISFCENYDGSTSCFVELKKQNAEIPFYIALNRIKHMIQHLPPQDRMTIKQRQKMLV